MAPLAAAAAVCPPAAFCGDFTGPTLVPPWDELNGNTESAEERDRYFQLVPSSGPLAVGRTYFRSTVDGDAVDGDEAGQRALVFLNPESDPRRAKTAAYEGSEQWYRFTLAFPRTFRPSPWTEWNWVAHWHNWPDTTCCANVALTVDTSHGRLAGRGWYRRFVPVERLNLRVMGGGDAEEPADQQDEAHDTPRARTSWFVGQEGLRREHWYDVLVHVRWSWRAERGLVEWWLDGRRVSSSRQPTLWWYGDNDSATDGESAGPGQAYWALGYYRAREIGGATDESTASVLYNAARRGPTRESVAY